VARRRLTIKRIDPWSVLKFGALLSVVLYLVFLVVAGVVWFVIDRLQLVDQACEIALDVGFTTCTVNAFNLFQVVALLGAMWIIVQTAVLVFLSFLHNLIADLTGGLVVGIVDDTPTSPAGTAGPGRGATSGRSERVATSSRRPSNGEPGTRAFSMGGARSKVPDTKEPGRRDHPRPAAPDDPLFSDDG